MSTTVNSKPGTDSNVLGRIEQLGQARRQLADEIGKVIVGQNEVIDYLLIGLLCRGHVLLHGVPGLGKTLMARTLAKTLDLDFKRVQFTPDLMPSDITGTDVLEPDGEGGHKMEFVPGPIFTNFLLADEINRTPPKTQASLLQAMQESEVSAGTQTYQLQPPFFVVATQNPIEMEGTYPLPEAQVDRFLFKIVVGSPDLDTMVRILDATTGSAGGEPEPVLDGKALLAMCEFVRQVQIADPLVRYVA
ncbi:MAG: AAA family ATPase, partial [Pirellulales bacterium]|nr:AAA family ATPase [Pirellulales bacterium]